jgi:sugar lactone lactonase YvrE
VTLRLVRAALIAASFLSICACAGGTTPAPPVGSAPGSGLARSRFSSAYPTKGLFLFEGDEGAPGVQIYRGDLEHNPAPIAVIRRAFCPYGMVVDKNRTLYVAIDCRLKRVQEYPRGQTKRHTTITGGIRDPVGLAMNDAGTLFVSSHRGITEYPFGGKSPSKVISGHHLYASFGLALDSKGNLYVAQPTLDQVLLIPRGTSNVIPLNLQDLTEPLGVAFDPKGNLWVTDGAGDRVNIYPPGSLTPSHSLSGFGFPYAISIDREGEAAITDLGSNRAVFLYRPGQYTPYALLTNGVNTPTGVLLTRL